MENLYLVTLGLLALTFPLSHCASLSRDSHVMAARIADALRDAARADEPAELHHRAKRQSNGQGNVVNGQHGQGQSSSGGPQSE